MNVEIEYGFRFDCYEGSFLTLENPSDDSPPQICFLRSEPVRPYQLDEYFALDFISSNGSVRRLRIPSRREEECVNFVAKVESQVEFVATNHVLERLTSSFLPARSVAECESKFIGKNSGFLVFLRVFKVKRPLPREVLCTGRDFKRKTFSLGSSQSQTFSTELGEAITPLYIFEGLKNEIVYVLKSDGVFLREYTTTEDDLNQLEERLPARSSNPKGDGSDIEFDDLEEEASEHWRLGRNRIDYVMLLDKVVNCAPGTTAFIEHVKSIRPPRFRETKRLTARYKDGDTSVFKRLIEMHYRQALRFAMWAHERWGYDLQDTIQESLLALFNSPNRYKCATSGTFPVLLNFYFRSAFERMVNVGCGLYNLSETDRMEVSKVRELWFKYDCEYLEAGESTMDEYYRNLISEVWGNFPQYSHDKICSLVDCAIGPLPLSYEELESCEYTYSAGGQVEYMLPCVASDVMYRHRTILAFLREVLTAKEMKVTCLRFGIKTDIPMTFAEIGREISTSSQYAQFLFSSAMKKLQQSRDKLKMRLS